MEFKNAADCVDPAHVMYLREDPFAVSYLGYQYDAEHDEIHVFIHAGARLVRSWRIPTSVLAKFECNAEDAHL
jgi:hypothetical protein